MGLGSSSTYVHFYFLTFCVSAHLVPVYSFGETDLYAQQPYEEESLVRWLQIQFNKIVGYPPAMFHGRGVFNYNAGILPFRRRIDTVGELPNI